MFKSILKRAAISFFISAMCGMVVNFLIDFIVWKITGKPFVSMSKEFCSFFPTPAMAAYVNVFIYGIIGGVFGGSTVLFELDRIGFVIQNLLYVLITSAVWLFISIALWQLHRYPAALISTLSGFLVTYLIVTVLMHNQLKHNISKVNLLLEERSEET